MSFEAIQLQFDKSLLGLTAFTASDGPLPTGVYQMQFTGAKLVAKKKNKDGTTPAGKNIELGLKVLQCFVNDAEAKSITPGSFVSREMRQWIPAPGTGGVNDKGESTDETGMRRIRAVLESIGYPDATIDGVSGFDTAYIVQRGQDGQPLRDAKGQPIGHVCYMHIVESNQTQDGDANFITKSKWELYQKGEWKPAETAKARAPQGGARSGGLPNVGQLPSVAGAMTGVSNPLGGAPGVLNPAAGNPAFQNGAGGSPPPNQPTAVPNGLGSLVL